MNVKRQPLADFSVVAHRGAMGHAPENTLAAFSTAIKMNSQMAELDIHLSGDGELIVIHDARLERTTDSEGVINDLSLAEIKKVDAGSHFSAAFANEPVPTLQEVIDLVKGKMALNVEVKAGVEGAYPGIIDRLIDHIVRNDMVDSVAVSSFRREYLLELRQKAPAISAALLYSKPFAAPWEDAVNHGWDLHPNYGAVDAELMDEAHRRQIVVRAWTVNEPVKMEEMLDLGVDAIITNFPDRLHEVIKKR